MPLKEVFFLSCFPKKNKHNDESIYYIQIQISYYCPRWSNRLWGLHILFLWFGCLCSRPDLTQGVHGCMTTMRCLFWAHSAQELHLRFDIFPHWSWPLTDVLLDWICLVPMDMHVGWTEADLCCCYWTFSAGEGTAWPLSLPAVATGCPCHQPAPATPGSRPSSLG